MYVQQPSAITNVVKSVQGTGHTKEMQSVVVNSTDGLFLGGYAKFAHPFEETPSDAQSMYFRCDETAEDMEYKLELSTVGDVSVGALLSPVPHNLVMKVLLDFLGTDG